MMETAGTLAELIDAYEAAGSEFEELSQKSKQAFYRKDEIGKQIQALMGEEPVIHNGKVWGVNPARNEGRILGRTFQDAATIKLPAGLEIGKPQ